MPSGAIITTVGLAKLASATPLNQLNISTLAVGDGNGGYPVLDPSMTALTNEVWRGTPSPPIRDPNSPNVLIFEAVIPPSVGGFTVREQAIFDDAGDMIAIGQTSVVEKPLPNDATGVILTVRLHIQLDNAGYVDLFFQDDPTISAGNVNNANGGSVQDFIDNLDQVHTRTFANVDAMVNFNGLVVGQRYSTGVTTWKIVTSSGLPVVGGLYAIPLNGVWIEDFGVSDGDDFSAELRLAVAVANGATVHIPSKRFLYDRSPITTSNVKIKGAKTPVVNPSFTSLEGGSIIQGTIQFTGKNVTIENFGVDLGSATGEADGDGIKCRYPMINSGGHLHTEGLIALLPSPSTPAHALLFESYQKHTGGNLMGVHGFFGFVSKCQNFQLGALTAQRNSSDGVYFKSDATDGKCAKGTVESILVSGNGGQTFGLRIQSAGDDIEDIKIGRVIIDGCSNPYKADLNGTNGTAIKNITIEDLLTKNATSRDCHVENGKATSSFIFNHTIKKLTCIDTSLEGYKVGGVGVLDFINLDEAFISYKTGVSSGQMEAGGVQVGAAVLRTKMGKITICQNYSTASVGGINYANQSSNNQLGMYTAKIFGSMPLSGDSSQVLSGATATLVVPRPAWNAKTCNARVTIAADTTITAFTENVLGAGLGPVFEVGTILTVINNSSFNLTINHNFGGNILNRGGVPFVLAGNEAAMYVYGGAVWHQV